MLPALRISTTKRSTTSRGSYAAQGGGGQGGGSGAAPTVASATPLAGDPAGGTAVTLAGTGFVTGATVTFGGSAATSVVVVSGLSITCVTPSGTAGPKNVVVTNPDAQTGTLTNGYAYVTVTSVSPTTGVVGTTITFTGTGFAAGQAVLIGGTAADNIVYTSSTSIDADVPSGVSGLVSVSVAGVTLANAVTVWGFDPTANGFTNIVNRPFSTKAASDGDRGTGSFPDKTTGSEGWDGFEWNQSNYALASAAAAPLSPSSVMRVTYPVGLAAGNGPGVMQTQEFTAAIHGSRTDSQLYVRGAVLLGPDYVVNTVVNKLWFHRTQDLTGRAEPFLLFNNNGSGGYKIGVNFQGCEDNPLGHFYATVSPGTVLAKSTWYRVESLLILNSGYGVGDGIFRLWLDSTLVLERTNVKYRPDATSGYAWSVLHVSPTWGGGGAVGTSFYFEVDQVNCWGKS